MRSFALLHWGFYVINKQQKTPNEKSSVVFHFQLNTKSIFFSKHHEIVYIYLRVKLPLAFFGIVSVGFQIGNYSLSCSNLSGVLTCVKNIDNNYVLLRNFKNDFITPSAN